MSTTDRLTRYRVLPVITPHDPATVTQLCAALQHGGMQAVEITLRTPQALAAITAVKQALPELVVAAGTVCTPQDMQQAAAAGADFCVSPGIAVDLLEAAQTMGMDFLPGVASASEILLGRRYGLDCLKFFPAQALGGAAALKTLAGPFPQVYFCPSGGLNADNFRALLALPNVVCCGGSWFIEDALVEAGCWDEITALAASALAPA